ncbi:MAG: chromosome segregation protein SMC, partial [Syntrophales bacterium]|nr:chromosome segregation protein SMC [Syntrophales bacterium]
KKSRLSSLVEIQENLEWCSEGTRSILKESRKSSWEAGRIHGLVAEQMDVPREYEVAVEAALGEKIQSILVEKHEDGIKAIDFLKNSGSGRGSFMPLEEGRTCDPNGNLPEHLENAVRLTDIVRPRKAELKKFIDRLFGDILLIPDLVTGTKLWRKNGFTGTFVTPEGDIISGSGILTGGRSSNGGHSLLRNKREISELQRNIDGLQEQLHEELGKRDETESRIVELEEGLENLRKAFHEQEILISEKKKDIERIEGEISWIDRQSAVLSFNKETMEREEEAARRRICESREEILKNEARISIDQDRIIELQEKWKSTTARLRDEEQELTKRKIALSSLEERRESGSRSLKTLKQTIREIDDRIKATSGDIEDCAENIRSALADADEAKKRLVLLYTDFEKAEQNLSEKREGHEALEKFRRDQESLLQSSRKNLDAVARELNRVTLDSRQVSMQAEALKTGVQERYHQDLQNMAHDFKPLEEAQKSELERKLAENKKRLDEFGEVNLLALSEYEELKQRHEFLGAQVKDLETSLETLQKTISRINKISKKRFTETFDGVNANFKRVFPRLFPGGRGSLHLTDESDMLETGIDIEIQIPGKKTQNLSLLSGGEKALAAVALIFSILMFRPTPFLVLDEADAPLDDSNVDLFTKMVADVARESQIIYITHNRRTMETADNLIGVTMQKSGISTIVSVNMN